METNSKNYDIAAYVLNGELYGQEFVNDIEAVMAIANKYLKKGLNVIVRELNTQKVVFTLKANIYGDYKRAGQLKGC